MFKSSQLPFLGLSCFTFFLPPFTLSGDGRSSSPSSESIEWSNKESLDPRFSELPLNWDWKYKNDVVKVQIFTDCWLVAMSQKSSDIMTSWQYFVQTNYNQWLHPKVGLIIIKVPRHSPNFAGILNQSLRWNEPAKMKHNQIPESMNHNQKVVFMK